MTMTTFTDKDHAKRYTRLQVARAIFAGLVTSLTASIAEPSTSTTLLVIAAALGVLIGGRLLHGTLYSFFKGIAFVAILGIGSKLGLHVLEWLNLSDAQGSQVGNFRFSLLQDHLNLLLLTFLVFGTSTVAFWCIRVASLLEVLLLSATAFYLMKGHRNYALDAPKVIADIAWHLQMDPAVLILLIGCLVVIAVLAYLFASEKRPLFLQSNFVTDRGQNSALATISTALLCLLALGLLGYSIYTSYESDVSRANSGVGQNKKEGESPLGFHSAVGKTKQPAALVRLQSDFLNNPWAPMLYLREGALSQFNGREIVNASSAFDIDVPRTAPTIEFQLNTTLPTAERENIDYSVYFLKSHPSLVAIDYPTVASPIEIPEDDRFVSAYKATSLSPKLKINEMDTKDVGDKQWSKEFWLHYLSAPGSRTQSPLQEFLSFNEPVTDEFSEDLRYKALAQQITKGLTQPIEKAKAIINYLSKESIYTRTPGHSTSESGDPVAAYLFAAEKRGYCVHFSHAAVYMMRLVGIPSRIGTGYLTDLRYAKDGHILLHLGDRHAWPEIYVEDLGWIIFDVSPQRAENEEELIPDEQLLEDLISKIDPIENFLPKAPKDEQNAESIMTDIAKVITNKKFWLVLCLSLLTLCLLIKLWLREGYRLAGNKEQYLKRRYRAALVLLCDFGISRKSGETRQEFAQRIAATEQLEIAMLTEYFIEETYARNPAVSFEQAETALIDLISSIDRSRGKALRLVSLLNPRSILARHW